MIYAPLTRSDHIGAIDPGMPRRAYSSDKTRGKSQSAAQIRNRSGPRRNLVITSTTTANNTRIAIVGAGVAGLVAARRLHGRYDINVFEAEDYAGGHAHTVAVEVDGREFLVDTGFIVCNDRNYPSFMALLNELGVQLTPTEMSFSVSNPALDLEYNGHNPNTLFAQRRNLLRGRFHRMLLEILRFNRQAKRHAGGGTVEDFLRRRKFSRFFAENYLLPMVAAIWSSDLGRAAEFPMDMLTRFFANHGLLNLLNRPRWFTVAGGSQNYVKALCADFKDRIHLRMPVRGVLREPGGVALRFDHGAERFDQVILACHSDQALALLDAPSRAEREILGAMPFQSNSVLLHHDASLMPKRRRAWASWNFRAGRGSDESVAPEYNPPVVTYCMNILQKLPAPLPLLVSLNAAERVDPGAVLAEFNYSHPQYSDKSLRAQARRREICGTDRIHYCGAWWHNGFHEDGVRSALDVCRRLTTGATSKLGVAA